MDNAQQSPQVIRSSGVVGVKGPTRGPFKGFRHKWRTRKFNKNLRKASNKFSKTTGASLGASRRQSLITASAYLSERQKGRSVQLNRKRYGSFGKYLEKNRKNLVTA